MCQTSSRPLIIRDQHPRPQQGHGELHPRQQPLPGHPVRYRPGEKGQEIQGHSGRADQADHEGRVGQGEDVPPQDHLLHLVSHAHQGHGSPEETEIPLPECPQGNRGPIQSAGDIQFAAHCPAGRSRAERNWWCGRTAASVAYLPTLRLSGPLQVPAPGR